jgi:hypothetical protein
MHNFLCWLHNLKGSFVFVTEGYSKLAFDLHNQCLVIFFFYQIILKLTFEKTKSQMSDVPLPDYFHRWFSIVKFWKQRYGNHKV